VLVEGRNELAAEPCRDEEAAEQEDTGAGDDGARWRRPRARPAGRSAVRQRMTRLSRSDGRAGRTSATTAGTKVNASTSAPRRASSTTCAMGRNIFPSMPVSVRIGR
jgi:hypothetical protein